MLVLTRKVGEEIVIAGHIRVTVQLGVAQTGVILWSDRFDRSLDDLFVVQEELANHIAALVDGQVGREALRRARRRPPANLDAYDLYLRGRELHSRTTEADTQTAREVLDRAIAADPNYAPAYAWQAYTVIRGFTLGWGEPRGRAALYPALGLATRAVELEPESALCAIRLAFTLSLLSRDDEALEIGRSAVHANPCDAATRATHGEILSRAGLHEAGVAELRLALSLNPFHPPFWRATLGRALLLADHPDDAWQNFADVPRWHRIIVRATVRWSWPMSKRGGWRRRALPWAKYCACGLAG